MLPVTLPQLFLCINIPCGEVSLTVIDTCKQSIAIVTLAYVRGSSISIDGCTGVLATSKYSNSTVLIMAWVILKGPVALHCMQQCLPDCKFIPYMPDACSQSQNGHALGLPPKIGHVCKSVLSMAVGKLNN